MPTRWPWRSQFLTRTGGRRTAVAGGETSYKKAMRLVDTQTVDGDVAFLTYEVVRGA
jgi:hypothetical protein